MVSLAPTNSLNTMPYYSPPAGNSANQAFTSMPLRSPDIFQLHSSKLIAASPSVPISAPEKQNGFFSRSNMNFIYGLIAGFVIAHL